MDKSKLEKDLLSQIEAVGLPMPEGEYKFHPFRRWRFDFAYPSKKIGVECEGGTWIGGRHTSGSGFAKDCEKYNNAAILGWTVLRFTGTMIDNGEAISMIEKAFDESVD